MSRLKKIAIGSLLIIFATVIAIAVYLFVDSPFPSYSISGLQVSESRQLPAGQPAPSKSDTLQKNISSKGIWFVDPTGRAMILHGINVGGSTKLPFEPLIPSHQKEKFYETVYTVSSVGRPFPLEQADEHFERLYQWGYRFVRLLVTWEAIEHAGPGLYDEDYLNYIQAIVKKAADHHINVFIDPHQDVWSRFTGGDGAPYWTLDKVGFDPLKFSETGSAIIHNVKGDPFPRMIWPTNYNKLGAATMFTLFFGGNDFAPQVKIDSVSAQDYLQAHYINAIKQVALKLKGLPNVIGFDTFNEPGAGYIGMTDLNAFGLLKNGVMPTPFEGMVLGAGNAIEVDRYEFALTGSELKGKVLVNPNRFSAWKEATNDIWKTARVWSENAQGKPELLNPDYFSIFKGSKVDFSENYFRPFVRRFKEAMHSVDESWLIFAEPALFHKMPKFSEHEAERLVNAGHWYDAATLLTKEYSAWFGVDVVKVKPVFGRHAIRETFHDNMANRKVETARSLGNNPTLVGEFGIPFDMGEKKAFSTGDFADQEACLDRSFRAMESNQLSYTLWNYTADNENKHGDQWNGEDLSIFSKSQQKNKDDINSGGRALAAAIRPYPYKVAGEPLEYFFNVEKKEFYLKFKRNKSIDAPTEIFLPSFHFGSGFQVHNSPGKLAFDKKQSLLLFYPDTEGDQQIVVKVKK
jgi:Glycoside hydrolase family 5 C-terminal domain/Cellulase (glycosyl hydrolase family 5)